MPLPPKRRPTRSYIPAAAHLAGANNTAWRTDLEVYNSGNSGAWYRDRAPGPRSRQLDAGESAFHALHRRTQFDTKMSSSRCSVSRARLPFASLRSKARSRSRAAPTISSRLGQRDSLRQECPRRRRSRFGQDARLIQLSQSTTNSSGFRTNIGFANATRERIRVEVELYSGNGTYLGTSDEWLEPLGFRQLNKVFKRVTDENIDDGYAIVRSTTEDAAFFCYATVIDNRSGDPILIPGRQ